MFIFGIPNNSEEGAFLTFFQLLATWPKCKTTEFALYVINLKYKYKIIVAFPEDRRAIINGSFIDNNF